MVEQLSALQRIANSLQTLRREMENLEGNLEDTAEKLDGYRQVVQLVEDAEIKLVEAKTQLEYIEGGKANDSV